LARPARDTGSDALGDQGCARMFREPIGLRGYDLPPALFETRWRMADDQKRNGSRITESSTVALTLVIAIAVGCTTAGIAWATTFTTVRQHTKDIEKLQEISETLHSIESDIAVIKNHLGIKTRSNRDQ